MGQLTSVLVANRGEIACRVLRTARAMGLKTVAVYSEADRGALHTELADTAVLIGPPPARDSYLDADRILAAATEHGVDAIHPGYGFLSENPDFARRCTRAGIAFVGPPAAAIEAMAIKGEAKRRMAAAGVPVLPGMDASVDDVERIADVVGFPLLVKPAAGGGGKGMKVVRDAASLGNALTSATREAEAAFGDGRLIVERFLEAPRHIEIQVFVDRAGNAVHLGERDCSLQRRHQKIIEESPAPGVTAALREQMGAAAVAAAKSIDYVGAGTVEFLLDTDGAFYFMEMNTRLQVEHPVTECVTGFDLVEWQLRLAGGENLPVSQDEVHLKGHAMEARIYAEDPANDFLPASGRLDVFELPGGDVRVDNGFRAGDTVSVFYDPMLAKIIAHGADRNTCMDELANALAALRVAGVNTNRDLLCHALAHPVLRTGRVTTGFLDASLVDVFCAPTEAEVHRVLAAAVLFLGGDEPFPNFRLNAPQANVVRLLISDVTHDVAVENRGDLWLVSAGAHTMRCRRLEAADGFVELEVDGERCRFEVIHSGPRLLMTNRLRGIEVMLPMETVAEPEVAGSLKSPMSGKVIEVLVAEGERVSAGAPLMTLEAMKMEHTISAPAAGEIRAIRFNVGDIVDEGVDLIELDTGEDVS